MNRRKKLSSRLYLSETRLRSHRQHLEGAKQAQIDRVLEEMRLLRKEVAPEKHFGERVGVENGDSEVGVGARARAEAEAERRTLSVRDRSLTSPDPSD